MPASDSNFPGVIKTRYSDSTPWWPEDKKPGKDAPNVLYILLDDTGYSQVGCYGSLVETPNIDSLAADGLRFRDFHVNAMCSPTRASLLSGCNNHTVGFGYLSNNDLGFPNLRGEVDPKYGFISETLQQAGYFTCALGKWHLTNESHISGAGPFDQWPCGRGFDKYYGFLNAMTSQYTPALTQGNEYVDAPKSPEEGYQLGADLIDKAIGYIGDQKSCAPEKPFFCYLAFGAMHGPHHAPRDYVERYKGQFDEGWDVYRDKVFAKQKELGLIPQDTVLTGHNKLSPAWDSLTDRQKKVFARYMEVFAGYLTYTDEQIGRLLDYLKKIGQYDNTMIVFLTDNGASAEGGPNGCYNEYYHVYSMNWEELVDDERFDELGSAAADSNYPQGWAWAGNAPLKWYKSWVHAGGIKVPCIISYPKMIKDKGTIRTQFHHVIDINSTVLDVCGIEQPSAIKGVEQEVKHGVSMRYSFDEADAPRQRKIQYFEMHGNRGIWCDGWKAVANHVDSPTFEDDVWELYNTDEDFSESNDLAAVYPEKLQMLKDLWWHEAGKFGVLPLIESHFREINGFNFNHMFKFPPADQKTTFTYYPEMSPNYLKPRLGNKSYTITAHIDYQPGDEGVLMGGGINSGGFALYIEQGRLKYHYNYLQNKAFDIVYDEPLTPGKHDVAFDFINTADNQGVGRLLVDGRPGGEVAISSFPLFPMPGTFAVSRYGESPINPAHRDKGYFKYNGTLSSIDLNLDRPADDLDEMMELEQALINQ